MKRNYSQQQSQSKTIQNEQVQEIAQNLVIDGYEKIMDQIIEGDTDISKRRTNLNFMLNQKKDSNLNVFKHRMTSVSEVYSSMSEDKDRTREMILKQKQHENRLENKAKEIEMQALQEQIERKQKLQQLRKLKNQQRKIKVLENIGEMNKRREMRKQEFKQHNQSLSQEKTKERLYAKLMDKWKIQQLKELEQKQIAMRRMIQRKKTNFEEIKEHANNYEEMVNKFRQSRISKVNQSRVSQSEHKKYYQGIFSSRVIQEEQQAKENEEMKKNLHREIAKKRQQYAEIVRQNYRPRVKQTLSDKASTYHQIRPSKSLSHIEQKKIGNNYLKEITSKIKDYQRERNATSMKNIFNSRNNKDTIFKYQNYLTEIKIKKAQSEKQMELNEKIMKQKEYEKEIKKIMKAGSLSEHEKFVQAKLVAKKMENRIQYGYKKNPFKLIDTINAKIEILKYVSK